MADAAAAQDVPGIDAPSVTSWFHEHVPGAEGPLGFELIAGGHSNLTYGVSDASGTSRWVLRRPPTGHVLATAHDMGREHRIISALGPTAVPVPVTHGLCEDEDVNGAPFYVMDFVDGTVARSKTIAEGLGVEQRERAGESIVDVLVDIHSVDLPAVGLDDLGRHEGYIERQLKRWHGQWEKSKTRELPVVDEVHAVLAANVPEQGPATIVHGDYRLDNCLVGADGSVAAVLDWELCTLGDPLADLGLLMVYWAEAGDPDPMPPDAPTTAEGFGSRKEVLERYAERSGRDLSKIDFYRAFGYWKLACIIEGVYARYAAGVMGRGDGDGEAAGAIFSDQVRRMAEEARIAAAEL
jgi:aminoglycoside phosphotransferase (APT) family kinase protein